MNSNEATGRWGLDDVLADPGKNPMDAIFASTGVGWEEEIHASESNLSSAKRARFSKIVGIVAIVA